MYLAGLTGSSLLVAYGIGSDDDDQVLHKGLNPVDTVPTPKPPITPASTVETGPITVDERFILGRWNAAQDPIEVRVSDRLRKQLGYSLLDGGVYSVDIPLPIKIPSLSGTEDQRNIFEEAAENRESTIVTEAAKKINVDHPKWPNPGNIIAVDAYPGKQPKAIVIYTHDVQPMHPPLGDLGLDIIQWVVNHPDREKEVIGQKVEFKTLGGLTFEGEIVHTFYVSQDYWIGADGVNSPWRAFEHGDNILFADSKALGISEELMKNLKEDEYLVISTSCLGADPGKTTGSYNENTANRLVVAYKVVIRK